MPAVDAAMYGEHSTGQSEIQANGGLEMRVFVQHSDTVKKKCAKGDHVLTDIANIRLRCIYYMTLIAVWKETQIVFL